MAGLRGREAPFKIGTIEKVYSRGDLTALAVTGFKVTEKVSEYSLAISMLLPRGSRESGVHQFIDYVIAEVELTRVSDSALREGSALGQFRGLEDELKRVMKGLVVKLVGDGADMLIDHVGDQVYVYSVDEGRYEPVENYPKALYLGDATFKALILAITSWLVREGLRLAKNAAADWDTIAYGLIGSKSEIFTGYTDAARSLRSRYSGFLIPVAVKAWRVIIGGSRAKTKLVLRESDCDPRGYELVYIPGKVLERCGETLRREVYERTLIEHPLEVARALAPVGM